MAESLTSIEPKTTSGSVQTAISAATPAVTTETAEPAAQGAAAESLTALTPPDDAALAEPVSQTALDKAKGAAEKAVKAAALNKQRREERAAIEQRAAQHEAENRRLREEAAERQRREDLYKTDKRAVLRDYDVDPKTLAQRQLDEQTPEGLRRSLEEKFRSELATERAAREALENSIRQREAAVKYATAEAAFRQEAADATKYPNVAQQPYQVVLTTAKVLIRDAFNRTGVEYSNAEVFSYLEGLYAKSQSAKPPGTAPTEKTETPASPRTINAKLASDRFSLPPNFDDLSDREQRRHLAKAYEQSGKK